MILGKRLTINILWLIAKTALPAGGFLRTETVENGLSESPSGKVREGATSTAARA
jgi:hypothetical protein